MSRIVSIYFNGTSDNNHIPLAFGEVSLAALLEQLTYKDKTKYFSFCVTGCGVETKNFFDFGGLFTFHLEAQISKIIKQVEEIIETYNEKVIINIYGFSRGGVAALLLCQRLKHLSENQLNINIVAFDPVPGNFVTTANLDRLWNANTTISSVVSDLTACNNIANLLLLFANEPLHSLLCHAPIFPFYPTSCRTKIDVTPGCHNDAVKFVREGSLIKPANLESAIVFQRIVEFMQHAGTRFDFNRFQLANDLIYARQPDDESAKERVLKIYEDLTKVYLAKTSKQNRYMHFDYSIITHNKQKKYLNRYHQELCGVAESNDNDSIMVVEDDKPDARRSYTRTAG